MPKVPRLPLWFLLAMLPVTVLVYLPGLGGPFVFDDHPNLVLNDAVQLKTLNWDALAVAMRSYGSENWNRGLSMLSFGLNYYVSGLDPLPYKLINLALHLINGVVFFAAARLFLAALARFRALPLSPAQIEWAAALGAVFWLLHPINLTTVLYIIQRMNLLAATFSLLGALFYLWGRLRMMDGRAGSTAAGGWIVLGSGVALCTLLSFFAKENGILLPLQILLIEWIAFGFAGISKERLRLLGWVGLALGAVAAVVLISRFHGVMNGYDIRSFDLTQRLLTEPRAIWFYLRLLLFPQPGLFGLFHDDMPISTGLFEPWTTLPALIGLALLLLFALLGHRRYPIVAFGILFFLLGHSLESTFLPLELVHEHRNYLPGIGILLPLGYGFVRLSDLVRRRVLLLAPAAFLIICGVSIAIRALDWRDPVDLALAEVHYHPNSSRANYQLAQLYSIATEMDSKNADEFVELARKHLVRAAELDPPMAGGILVGYALIEAKTGREVPAELEARIDQALEQDPPAVLASSNLIQLFECVQKKLCVLPYPTMIGMLEAFDRNPRVWQPVRAKVYASILDVAISQGDWGRVLRYAEAAATFEPNNIQHWLNYASVLVSVGDQAAARSALEQARNRDRFGAYQDKITGIERTLGPTRPGVTEH